MQDLEGKIIQTTEGTKYVLTEIAVKRWDALAKDGWMLIFITSRCWRTTAKCTTKPQRNITWSNHGRNWI